VRPSETKTIGGLEVTTTKLPAMRGSALRFKLGKLILPSLRGKSLAEISSIDIADLAPVVGALDEKAQETLMLEILLCTKVQQTNDKTGEPYFVELTSQKFIDLVFDGDVDALWATCWFALEVNLKGVFGASAGSAQPAPTP
jgi:hypothetical protein